jgi:hypothetical protein
LVDEIVGERLGFGVVVVNIGGDDEPHDLILGLRGSCYISHAAATMIFAAHKELDVAADR